MLAIIMAGGEGERLRPLTCTKPKPMLPLLDKPILYHTFQLLKKHGIKKAALTLGYLPDQITDEFEDGEDIGIELQYYHEKTPLGTAGGVKLASDFLRETFIVLSGDGVTDMDLKRAVEFHKSKGALATICVTRVSDPTEYGLVNMDQDGKITSFSEKPAWGFVDNDTANTGIYIMEPEALKYIPDHTPFDFGKDLFPMLLNKGKAIYGFVSDAYWCDIGDVSAYIKANMDALYGQISTIEAPFNTVIRMPGAIIDEHTEIKPPAFIASGVRIYKNVRISEGAVIGSGTVIEEGASVKRSVVMNGASIGSGCQLRSCIISENVRLDSDASAFEDSVIAHGAVIGSRASVSPGVRIWPYKQIREGRSVRENVIWGQQSHPVTAGARINIKTPEEACRAARALAWKMQIKTALVGKSASAVSASQAEAFSAGLSSSGVQVYETGECTLPQLRFALSCMQTDAAFYVPEGAVTPIRRDLTYYLAGREKRALEAVLSRQSMPQAYTGIIRHKERAGRIDLSYLAFLKSAAFGSVRRLHAAVYSQREQLLYLADRAFSASGFSARVEWEEELMELNEHEIGIYLSNDGETCDFASNSGMLDEAEKELLICWALLESGEKTIYAPPSSTRAAIGFIKNTGANLEYAIDDASWAKSLIDHSPHQFHMRFDGLFMALNILSHLNDKQLSLSDFVKQLPKVKRIKRRLHVDFLNRGKTMQAISNNTPSIFTRSNMFYESKNGCAWIQPEEDSPYITVTAESMKAEFAEEICGIFSDIIEKAALDE